MAQAVSLRPLRAEAWFRFEDIPSRICCKIIVFFLSTSVLPCQDYSAHFLYSSSPNVFRTIKKLSRHVNFQIGMMS